MQQSGQTEVAFEAARLGIQSVLLVALLGELLLDGPRPRPHRRIFDRDLVCEGLWPGARPPLNQMQVLARALIVGFRSEVGDVDDEGFALPMAARVAEPLTDVGWQVRASVHDDVALPPLSLTDVVEHRDTARRLHDPAETASGAAELRQSAGQAPHRQRTVLRTIVAIQTPGVVARRSLGPSRRGGWFVLSPRAARQLFLARIGRLQQRETIFPFGGRRLLSVRRERRNAAIGRIDDLGCPRPGALRGKERRSIVGAVDFALGRETAKHG